MRGPLTMTVAALVLLGAPAGAAAHVQVRPATAAPGDPVLWTVPAPSEQEAGTERVELAIPAGVLPFSFEDAPGWTWTCVAPPTARCAPRLARAHPRRRPGHLPLPGLDARARGPRGVEGDPDLPRRRGGALDRFPAAEYPASVTTISRAAPRENAGEGSCSGGGSPVAGAGAAPAGTSGGGGDGGTDWLARGLALAALLAAGGIGIASALARSR